MRLQKLPHAAPRDQAKHDAAIAKYANGPAHPTRTQQPKLYETARSPWAVAAPDAARRHRPSKEATQGEKATEGEAVQRKKPPKEKPPKEKPATTPKQKEPAHPAWQPPANLPRPAWPGTSVLVEAVPNGTLPLQPTRQADFARRFGFPHVFGRDAWRARARVPCVHRRQRAQWWKSATDGRACGSMETVCPSLLQRSHLARGWQVEGERAGAGGIRQVEG